MTLATGRKKIGDKPKAPDMAESDAETTLLPHKPRHSSEYMRS
jgi:hypothetical protein